MTIFSSEFREVFLTWEGRVAVGGRGFRQAEQEVSKVKSQVKGRTRTMLPWGPFSLKR